MSEGKKFDSGKLRMDLISSEAMRQLASVLGAGAEKYGDNNWRAGLKWSRVYAAVQRHLTSWNDGETCDPETGLNHLAHAMTGLHFLLEYAKTHAELDDRHNKPLAEGSLLDRYDQLSYLEAINDRSFVAYYGPIAGKSVQRISEDYGKYRASKNCR